MSIRIILALVLMALTRSVLAADFPAPPDSSVDSVSGSTTSLGMHLRIRKFQSDLPVEEVLSYYRDYWKDVYAETEMPPWKMIGTRQGGEYFNVQVQTRGSRHSWGYLSISDLPEKLDKKTYKLPSGGSFPMMSGSRVMDNQVSKDPGKTGRVLLIQNNFSVQSNHNFYRRHYGNNGWFVEMDEQTAPRNQGYALYARKGPQSVGLTIDRLDGHTSIVANEVTRGLLR